MKGIDIQPDALIVEVQAMEVGEFVPAGESQATQVHIVFQLMDANVPPLVMRLKSGAVCDSIIAALIEHRLAVFGAPEANHE